MYVKKVEVFRGGGGENFGKRRNTHLRNVARNKCTKFGPNRSSGSMLKIGGKKSREKKKEEKKKKKCVLDPKMAFFE